MFTAVLCTIAKVQKQSKCLPTDKWIKNLRYIHTHTTHIHRLEYYLVFKKKEILSFVTT